MCVTVNEEIDERTFLDLSEEDIKSMTPKLGIVKKILRLQKVSKYSACGTADCIKPAWSVCRQQTTCLLKTRT